VVHKHIARCVIKKPVCNDKITALKLQAEPAHVLIVQV
jgi:hypothetical protein